MIYTALFDRNPDSHPNNRLHRCQYSIARHFALKLITHGIAIDHEHAATLTDGVAIHINRRRPRS